MILPAAWGASDPVAIAATPTSRVLRVRMAGGGTAVIKDLKPSGVEDELRGADFLAWRQGAGCVRLLARDDSTLLLEDAGDRSLLDDLNEHGDEAATAIAADLMRAMHAPSNVAPPRALMPLEERFAGLFALALADADAVVREGAAVARTLLADQHGVRPLHGDFHHENALLSGRGWLAIDPKGLIGDPAYDAANLFCNPLARDDLRLDPRRIRTMAAILAPPLDRDSAIVLRWAFAHACLSAAWHLEDGEAAKAAGSLAVARAIRGVIG